MIVRPLTVLRHEVAVDDSFPPTVTVVSGKNSQRDAAAAHGAADLRVVAEAQADDGVAVAVVRQVRTARRRNELRVEAEAELAELRRAGADCRNACSASSPVFGRRLDHLPVLELEPDPRGARVVQKRAAGIDQHAVDRRLDRRDADDAGRQLDFAIDAHLRLVRARLRRVAVLLVERPIAHAEADVGAGGRRHAHLAGAQRGDGLILPRPTASRSRCRARRRRSRSNAAECTPPQAVGDRPCRRPSGSGSAGRCPSSSHFASIVALVGRRRRVRRRPAARCRCRCRSSRACEIRRGPVVQRLDLRRPSPRAALRTTGSSGAERGRVVSQQHAFAGLHLERGDDARRERGIRNGSARTRVRPAPSRHERPPRARATRAMFRRIMNLTPDR